MSDYSPTGGSSFFFDYSNYLANLFHPDARADLARNYCDVLGTSTKEGCRRIVIGSLRSAVERLSDQQGTDPAQWSTPAENIVFQELGAGSVDPIPWQNRGTHNHVVEVLGDAGS